MEAIVHAIQEMISNLASIKVGLTGVYSSLIVIALISLIFSRIGK